MRSDDAMMSALAVEPMLTHDEQYTVGDWLKLPESKQRVELIHGSFVVSPAPATDHQIAAQRCVHILLDAAPDDLEVVEYAGIRCGEAVLIPDVIVAEAKVLLAPTTLLEPHDVRAVVEIASPGNRRRDLQHKPKMYSAAGIPVFISVEVRGPRAPRVKIFALGNGGYKLAASAVAGETLRISRPFEVSLDPAWLAGPRRPR